MSRFFQSVFHACFVVTAVLVLIACGDSSGSGGDPGETPAISSNVALAASGATITSSFSGNESFVIDGDTGNTGSWEPGANNDTLTIDFSQSYSIESVKVYHANMTSTSYFSLEFSTDGSTFSALNNITGCSTRLYLGASEYTCVFGQTLDARYFRLTILNNAVAIDVHEIQVMGL